MQAGDVVTYSEGDLWFVRIEGEREPTSSHTSRGAAVSAGRRLATSRQCEHIVVEYVPRGYAVQSELGAVTGGQASLY